MSFHFLGRVAQYAEIGSSLPAHFWVSILVVTIVRNRLSSSVVVPRRRSLDVRGVLCVKGLIVRGSLGVVGLTDPNPLPLRSLFSPLTALTNWPISTWGRQPETGTEYFPLHGIFGENQPTNETFFRRVNRTEWSYSCWKFYFDNTAKAWVTWINGDQGWNFSTLSSVFMKPWGKFKGKTLAAWEWMSSIYTRSAFWINLNAFNR